MELDFSIKEDAQRATRPGNTQIDGGRLESSDANSAFEGYRSDRRTSGNAGRDPKMEMTRPGRRQNFHFGKNGVEGPFPIVRNYPGIITPF